MFEIDEMFAELCEEMGYATWYEAEEAWEEIEMRMIESGLDAEEVHEFFQQMAWDL